ncbi:MAG TPA: hypothetical protein VFN48_01765 [Solirubrobacteraceae bacterium]|nr:hypothetical protein [Solirubrobacteraceae bacterium]
MKHRAALGAALLLGAGLAIGACAGGQDTTTAASALTGTGTTTTVSTATITVVGTTPAGLTVSQTVTHVDLPSPGPHGVALETGPPLGAVSTTLTGLSVDDIECDRIDQLAYRTYVHLQVTVRGHRRALPGGIGLVEPHPSVASDNTTTTYSQTLCSYWLSTSAANGVIRVQSPVPARFTLGEFFDVWGQPLSRNRVAGARGPVRAFVNGRRWTASPRTIPLREHEEIGLAVGRPVPRFRAIDWSNTGL